VSARHEIINPESLAPPAGFAHAVAAGAGRLVYLGGQAGLDARGALVGDDLDAQFDQAASNLVAALAAAGGSPGDLVSLHIYVTEMSGYRARLQELGAIYRRHFGRHYPAIALFGVGELFDPGALVELVGVAVVPEQGGEINPAEPGR
jgi:enamine deaminase RidA (YjgF/YER057c/UK114 family)